MTAKAERTASIRGRLTERSFYPALIDEIRGRGGSAVSEVLFNSEPDILFRLLDRDWLLSVKIGESAPILRSAFIQYQRHKNETQRSHGLLLFLPEGVRDAEATEGGMREGLRRARCTLLVDTPVVQTELRDATLTYIFHTLLQEVGPKLQERLTQAYPLRLVIALLQDHVRDLMKTISLSEPLMLRIVTDRKLLSGIGGHLSETETQDVGRFLASYIVLSQVLFLRMLGTAMPHILPPRLRPVTHHSLREAFRRVLNINYQDIYEVDVLDAVSEEYLRDTFDLIWGLEVERVRYELPGRIFHELMPTSIRKMLAAFYTRPQAADILSHLTITRSNDTAFDPACGSGTILASAYRRKLELFHKEGKAGNPHKRFTEEEIFGGEIMPFGVHLTSANLAAMEPATAVSRTQVIQGDSLKLVAGRKYRHGLQLEMFRAGPQARTATGESYPVNLGKVRTVLMNPPFTKVERGIQKYVDMKRFRDVCGGEVGLWGHFVALADEFLEDEGSVGAVLPINLLRGRESNRIRDFAFSEWTPLYILKATFNYGFSEWSEYRDILFIARKGAPPPDHSVKFCLVKKDLRKLDEDDIRHITHRIQSFHQLRSDDLDIETFPIAELRERFVNLMWFCGVSDFRHRDLLTTFMDKFAGHVAPFPKDYFREGYRPVPKGVSHFLFLTRNLETSRIDEAFLHFDQDHDVSIQARSKLDVPYDVEKSALVPTLRTGIGIRTMGLDGRHDYIAGEPYRLLDRVKRASGFRPAKGFDWEGFWANLRRELRDVRTRLVVVHRINPYSPATYLTAFLSNEHLSPSNVLNVVQERDLPRAKAVCVLLNSIVFLSQFFLLKEETTGRYINVRFYDLHQMHLYPKQKAVRALGQVYDAFADVEFPSLREQFDADFDNRYEQFWTRQRTAQLPLKLLSRRVRPSSIRLQFDQAVCRALGTPVTPRELIRVYGVIVAEMIMTRGLQRD
jgi:hypothetical protein